MAVYDNYVDTQILAGRTSSALSSQGAGLKVFALTFNTTADHDANSIYRVIKSIPCTAVPVFFNIWTDGVTGMNDVNVGTFQVGAAEPAVDENCLADALDLSSQVLKTAALDGMILVSDSTNFGKALWEISGQTLTDRFAAYDIGLTSVADLSEADSINIYAGFVFQ